MKIEINLGDRLLAFILTFTAIVLAIGIASAYQSGGPASAIGHSIDELELDPLNIDQANDRVGIGKTPTTALDVQGNIVASGTICDSGGTNCIGGSSGSGQVAVLTGSVPHGGTIPLPSGYSQSQCNWTVSIRTLTSTTAIVEQIQCYASSSRVVTCRWYDGFSSWKNGTANYMIICVK